MSDNTELWLRSAGLVELYERASAGQANVEFSLFKSMFPDLLPEHFDLFKERLIFPAPGDQEELGEAIGRLSPAARVNKDLSGSELKADRAEMIPLALELPPKGAEDFEGVVGELILWVFALDEELFGFSSKFREIGDALIAMVDRLLNQVRPDL